MIKRPLKYFLTVGLTAALLAFSGCDSLQNAEVHTLAGTYASVREDSPESVTATNMEEQESSAESTVLTGTESDAETLEMSKNSLADSIRQTADVLGTSLAGLYRSIGQICGLSAEQLPADLLAFLRERGRLVNDTAVTSASRVSNLLSRLKENTRAKLRPAEPDSGSPEVYNLLIIGSDRRDTSWWGNSDVMLVASVNKARQTITLVSLMRDLGVTIPGYGYGKLNWAYAKGGPDLLVSAITQNFQLNIDSYFGVDFTSCAAIFDLFGGSDINLSEAEAKIVGTEAGLQHLNGAQTVTYCRIRYVGNSDYQRTERQRTVLSQLINKAKAMDTKTLTLNGMKVLTMASTNITSADLVTLLPLFKDASSYTLQTIQVPYNGLYHSNGENLDPDWQATIEKLHGDLY